MKTKKLKFRNLLNDMPQDNLMRLCGKLYAISDKMKNRIQSELAPYQIEAPVKKELSLTELESGLLEALAAHNDLVERVKLLISNNGAIRLTLDAQDELLSVEAAFMYADGQKPRKSLVNVSVVDANGEIREYTGKSANRLAALDLIADRIEIGSKTNCNPFRDKRIAALYKAIELKAYDAVYKCGDKTIEEKLFGEVK